MLISNGAFCLAVDLFVDSQVAQLVKNPPAKRETWVGKIPWRREQLPTPVFWPGEFHGLENSYSLKVAKSWTRLSDFHFSFSFVEQILIFCMPVSLFLEPEEQ